MRSLIAVAICALALGATAVPAAAGGTFTQTVHIHSLAPPFGPLVLTAPPAAPANCPFVLPVIMTSSSGNGVEHLTVNGNGGWFTATYEGDAQMAEVSFNSDGTITVGPTLFDGHLTTWFGAEDNNQNSVFHTTLNYNATGVSDPSQSLGLHANFDVTVNANGKVTATPTNVSCR